MQEKRCAITQSTSQAQSGSTPRPSNPLSFPFYPFRCAAPRRTVLLHVHTYVRYILCRYTTELSRLATFALFLFVRNTRATMIVWRKWNADSLVFQPGSFFRRVRLFKCVLVINVLLGGRNGSKKCLDAFLLPRRVREMFSVLIYSKVERVSSGCSS